MVSKDGEYRGGEHQQMTPNQTLNPSRDDRRRTFTTGQPPFVIDRRAVSHQQSSLKQVPESQRRQREYRGQYMYNEFNERPNGFAVPGRGVDNLQHMSWSYSSDQYLYDTSTDGISDQQRVTAV